MAIESRFVAYKGLDNNGNTIVNVRDPELDTDAMNKRFGVARAGDEMLGPLTITTSNQVNLTLSHTGLGNALLINSGGNSLSVSNTGKLAVGHSDVAPTSEVSIPLIGVHGAGVGTTVSVTDWSSTATASAVTLLKSRGGSTGTFANVISGDTIGRVSWDGASGGKFIRAAEIAAVVDGTPTSNGVPAYISFKTANTSGVLGERFRIGTDSVSFFSGISAPTVNGITGLATTPAVAGGVASQGTSTYCARADHSHPTDPNSIQASEKGAPLGVATLGNDGKVPATQLPSFVDDVLEYPTTSSFPLTGEGGKIYLDMSTSKIYRWSGSSYVDISAGGGTSDAAYKLAVARTIALSGAVSGSTVFDGTANVTINATIANNSIQLGVHTSGTYVSSVGAGTGGVQSGSSGLTLVSSGSNVTLALSNTGITPGTYSKIAFDAQGRALSGGALTAEDLNALSTNGGTINGAVAVGTNTATAVISVIQTGVGPALTVQDTPGKRPIVITNDAALLIGSTATNTGNIGGSLQMSGFTSGAKLSLSQFSNNSTYYPEISLFKSRSNSQAFGVPLQNNDTVGQVNWYGDSGDPAATAPVAKMGVYVDGTVSSGVIPGRVVWSIANASGVLVDQFSISSNGTVTAGEMSALDFNSTSDERKKTNIQSIVHALDTVNQLRGVTFDWKETGKHSMGVIAQEIEEVLPHTVVTDSYGYKSVSYNNLVGLLIEAVKELSNELTTLTSLVRLQ